MIDLVVIVYKAELEFLKIQAKSLHLYFSTHLINNIYIIVNDENCLIEDIKLNWWRDLASKVKILHYSYLSDQPTSMHGWDSQQLLKILTASISNCEYSLVLDAKTWFVKSVQFTDFFDNNGRFNCTLMPLFTEFQSSKNFLSDFFQIEFNSFIGPGGVPFAFHSDTVRKMIEFIEGKTNLKFDKFFSQNVIFPNCVTEFTLYSAFVLSNKLFTTLYSGYAKFQVTNIADFEYKEINQLLQTMKSSLNLTSSIHKNTYKLMNNDQFESWCNFLTEKKLFVSPKIAQMQLNTFKLGVDNGTRIRF